MEQLLITLDKLLKYKNEDPSRFYTLLSNYKLHENDERYFMDNFVPKVYHLYEKKVLHKDLVYLSLLATENFDVLEKFISYDKSEFVLNIEDPVSLFDYYVYKRKHWLYEVIDKPSSFDKLIPLKPIYNKLNMIKYVKLTNSSNIDTEYLEHLSSQIDDEYLDDFWKFYKQEIARFIDTVKFCKTATSCSVEDDELFKFASRNTLLNTLSTYTDLKDSTQWEHILQKIEDHKEMEQSSVFTGFIIVATIINLIINNNYNGNLKKDFINTLLDDMKCKLLHLQDKQLQIELLENIFSLLFHRNGNDFTCKEKETRFILFLLKTVIDEIKLKKQYDKGSNEYERLSKLNIYVADALWRLDLILSTKISPKIEDQLLNYMLAPPESLIHLCLKQENFERAYQVVEIFNLRDTDAAQEVRYAEIFLKFKKFLRKNGKLKASLRKSVEDFFEANPPYVNKRLEESIEKLSPKFDYKTHFKAENELFFHVFDLALTEGKCKEECDVLLKLAEENFILDTNLSSNYLQFYNKITQLFRVVNLKDDKSVSDILISPNYPFDVKSYKAQEDFYEELSQLYDDFDNHMKSCESGILNKNHSSHKTLLKMNEACNRFLKDISDEQDNIPYLLKVFNYLKAFSRILYIEQNSSDIISKGKNSSYFELFNFNRSELTGKLLFERQLDPTEFERYFGKLKLDFLYHVVGNCFPTINLHVQENVTIEELYHDNMLYIPSRSIIVYIQKRNWLLAFILNEMYKVEGIKIDISEIRLRTFFNYLKMAKIQHLKVLFEQNDIVAALQNCISAQKVKLYFQEQIIVQDLMSINSQNSNTSNDGCETGEEIMEDTKTTNWKSLHDIIESIPENQLKKKTELIVSKDNVLVNLVQDGFEPEYYKYAHFICNRDLRIETILNNFKKWPGEAAMDIIKSEISRFDCGRDTKLKMLQEWLDHIELNEELKTIFDLKSWYRSYDFCKNYPESALQQILQTNNVDLVLRFIKLYNPSEELLYDIDLGHVTKIIELNTSLVKVKDLLDSLPFNHTMDICHSLLSTLRKIEYLQFIADYLNNNVLDDTFLKNARVSLKMLSVFTTAEQEQLFCLINEPLSILEVLIMNTKLDKFAVILELLKMNDSYYDYQEMINTEKIDHLLRTYAEKSLDFRVITQPNPRLLKTPEYKLMQSLDSLSLLSDKKLFVVPVTVPSKEEWVQNDEVLECMCCRQVTFSMFNRRHHCRRCGRVVCYNCSLKRMLVPTYGDILVRVCSDCYEQTVGTSSSSERSDGPSTRSIVQEYWLLNDDPEHNKIVREEFSYEHAPSISLCFSILKYHSKSVEYPKFLLEQCEVMLKLLQPIQEPTQEIDYLLVIKMLKSLAIAAKMNSNESMLSSGTSMADRILSQAELLALLAERGCLNLMPVKGAQTLYVDAAVLRRLRDKLLQREQWNLALEVSTKAGLDNTGVFAAWGKSCLKAGSLLLAREKFQRCLDKNSQYETLSMTSRLSDLNKSIDSINLNRSRMSSRISNSSFTSENKPTKDPPLLHEILQILESKTRAINPTVVEESRSIQISGSVSSLNQLSSYAVHTDTAIDILNRIQNLKQISSGNYSLSHVRRDSSQSNRPKIDPIFYDECVYYLTKYGTHLSLLEFFIKHDDINTALMYIIDNKLSSEIFIEIYAKCLRDGIVNRLQEQMSRIDCSLDLWKDYLKQVCRHLEKQQLLNCLYQLQLYIGDYVRAAMTCIRFYQDNVKSFTELANNVRYLHKGEEHLRQVLEQEQWVEVTSVGKISNESKDSFEERMLTNPDLVMKIDSKDVHKHINTVTRQIEIVNFLAKCEDSGTNTKELLRNLILSKDSKSTDPTIPTLFGSNSDKINLAVLAIISGSVVEDGFQIAQKIIEDFRLRPIKIYCLAGKQFAKSERYNGITQLVSCIKSTEIINDAAVTNMLDEMLSQAVGTLIKANVTGTKVEDLIKLISDKATKISAYIEAKQLKTAYFLAVRNKRTADIRRIQREAELLNMPSIKALCQKVLQNSAQTSTTHSKDS